MKQYNISNIEQLLVQFGLTPKQSRVYLTALRLGSAPVQEIAKEAKIGRTNVYDAIEGLVARGLMSISTEGKKRLFSPEPPEKLERVLSEKQELLEVALPQLQAIQKETDHKPRILYYPGIEGYKQAYEDTLTSKEKKLFGIFSVQDVWEVVGREYADRIIARRVKQGIALQVIRSKEKDVGYVYPTNQKELREMRHAPRGMVFPITTYVYDNKVVILSSKKEMFGLLIESEDIAHAHRNYFQALWQISMPS